MNAAAGIPAVPRATLRVQFSKDFTFDDATRIVPYLAKLGISHLYASPILRARAGSTHGYDIIDHAHLNPEIGDEAALTRLTDALHAHGMGLIVDFVPNHMGVGGTDNGWWLDVLEWGQLSPFAKFFDINWEPAEESLYGKVLVPFLGDHYGAVLERGEIQLAFDAGEGRFTARYFEHGLPIAPSTYAQILARVRRELAQSHPDLDTLVSGFGKLADSRRAEAMTDVQRQALLRREAEELRARLAALVAAEEGVRDALDRALAALNGTPGEPASFEDLHRLLEAQSYRLAFWRVASDEINYRRFFDVNVLAGLRIEEPELFELAHQLLFRLVGEGKLQGIRLDHIDGLYDPAGYLARLQDRLAYLEIQNPGTPRDPEAPRLREPFYVLVEKILAPHEQLRPSWPVAGTTGYEFMNLVNGLFVDPAGEGPLTALYDRVMGRQMDFEEIVLRSKRRIVTIDLASELHVLALGLRRIALQNWRTRDYTLSGLQKALSEVVIYFPVYRTYITPDQIEDEDRRTLDWAIGRARKASGAPDRTLFDFLYGVLSGDLARDPKSGYRPEDVWRLLQKFQQFTGPAMAKSLEDTAFYRYFRLVSLNEVGGEPAHWSVAPAQFHRANQERLKRTPNSLLATATHDAKRGEDVRTRIDAISELPGDWGRRVRRWTRLNRYKKRDVNGQAAPLPNDEYLFYQTLVGAWPNDLDPTDADGLRELADRLVAYMMKAVRESKERSSWTQPDEPYEQALEAFVRAALEPGRSRLFLTDVVAFQERVALVGAVNGLAQALLKTTVPGVPDFYQGTDFWELSLVDPDNRRPVDWERRLRTLEAEDDGADVAGLIEAWRDGRIKQHVTRRALAARARWPALFAEGEYLPVEAEGRHADRIVAFLRRHRDRLALIVAPRLVLPLLKDAATPLPQGWGDTVLKWPEGVDPLPLTDMIGGGAVEVADGGLPVAKLLEACPVALLVPREG